MPGELLISAVTCSSAFVREKAGEDTVITSLPSRAGARLSPPREKLCPGEKHAAPVNRGARKVASRILPAAARRCTLVNSRGGNARLGTLHAGDLGFYLGVVLAMPPVPLAPPQSRKVFK
jgi:hypothetical protein